MLRHGLEFNSHVSRDGRKRMEWEADRQTGMQWSKSLRGKGNWVLLDYSSILIQDHASLSPEKGKEFTALGFTFHTKISESEDGRMKVMKLEQRTISTRKPIYPLSCLFHFLASIFALSFRSVVMVNWIISVCLSVSGWEGRRKKEWMKRRISCCHSFQSFWFFRFSKKPRSKDSWDGTFETLYWFSHKILSHTVSLVSLFLKPYSQST